MDKENRENYRVVGRKVTFKRNGEVHEEIYNVLQERIKIPILNRFIWKDIEKELVPSHVFLQQCCFGDCVGSKWVSKFIDYVD